ncbi:MAG: c-type cytochrome [Mariprofundaceae bacterium]
MGSAYASNLPDGKKLYETNCSKCHSVDGSVTDYGRKLKPFPARNHRAAAPYLSTDELRRIIMHGTHMTSMRAMKYKLDPFEIEALVDYIKTFTYTPNLTNGKARFKAVCASCHGNDGRAKTNIGAKNLVYSKLDLSEIVHTIRYGRSGTLMTAKRHQLSNTDIADIANYVYSLRYQGDAGRGAGLYANSCKSCHAAPKDIRIVGHAAKRFKKLSDLDDHMLDLRIRHGRHVDREGRKAVKSLSDDEVQDIIAYMRQETK